MRRAHTALLAAALALACETEAPPPERRPVPRIEDLPRFAGAELEHGRTVWIERCAACHLGGLAGAPRILDREAWKPRIAQGLDVLVRHATQGFESPAGNQMPARGGHADLGDGDVAAAVAFVVAASGGPGGMP